jgi:hypothetical protein
MPIILILRRLRQKDLEFEASLGYIASSRLAWATQQDPVSNKTWQLCEIHVLEKRSTVAFW